MRNRVVRIKDIAEKAQVSTGTVDRVIHNRGRVAEEVRQKVLQIIEELNYQPNLIARTLKSNRSYTLAALLPDPASDSYWQGPQAGIEKAATELGQYGILVEQFIFDPYQVESFLEQARQVSLSKPDGIILAPIFHKEVLPFFQDWQQARIPYVLFNTQIPQGQALSYIGQDSYQSGLLAAHLLQDGIPGPASLLVAHIGEDILNSAHLLEKEKGFRDYFPKNKLEKSFRIFQQVFQTGDRQAFASQLAELLVKHPDLKGIFITNSKAHEMAAYLEQPAFQHLRLVGYDLLPENLAHLETGRIRFLINQNPIGQGYWGVHQLTDYLVFKKDIPPVKYLPLDIITRENLRYYVQ
ncbi:MAG: LacI family DNA-binding transcriptional regulator [Adhaeribacter sp.]